MTKDYRHEQAAKATGYVSPDVGGEIRTPQRCAYEDWKQVYLECQPKMPMQELCCSNKMAP